MLRSLRNSDATWPSFWKTRAIKDQISRKFWRTVFPENMASCLRLVSTNSRTSSVIKSRCGIRNFHKRVPLPYPIADGLGDFLPPAALKTLVEYQDGLLSRLNDEVRGTSIKSTIISVYDIIPLYS